MSSCIVTWDRFCEVAEKHIEQCESLTVYPAWCAAVQAVTGADVRGSSIRYLSKHWDSFTDEQRQQLVHSAVMVFGVTFGGNDG